MGRWGLNPMPTSIVGRMDGPGDDTAPLLSDEEARVLGCLLEKERTTPDDYPLTANAVQRAANQTTSREPVVSFDSGTVERTLSSLKAKGVVRFVHLPSGRATTRYRHVAGEAWGLDDAELTVLGLLLLRGPQSAGELRTRSERWHAFDGPEEVAATLERLSGRTPGLVREVGRQPGQRETRWAHLLCGEPDLSAIAHAEVRGPSGGGPGSAPVGARLDALEREVAELRDLVADLRAELGLDPPAVGGPS